MASFERRNVEILVQAKAPSRGADDAKYRALAEVYLSFEPATRHVVDKVHLNLGVVGSEGTSQAHSTQETRSSKQSYRPDDEVERPPSPIPPLLSQDLEILNSSQLMTNLDLSFEGAEGNVDSPVLRRTVRWHDNAEDMESSRVWETTYGSEVSDWKSELPDPLPEFSSPSVILERYLAGMRTAREKAGGMLGDQQRPGQAAGEQEDTFLSLPLSSTTKQQLTVGSSPIQLSSSPSPPNRTSRSATRLSQARDKRQSDKQDPPLPTTANVQVDRTPEGVSASALPDPPSKSVPFSADSHRPQKRLRTDPPSSSPVVGSSMVTVLETPGADKQARDWSQVLEIRPSLPAVGMVELQPEMLVTSKLQGLYDKRNLLPVYNPSSRSRDVRPMERGYWIVDCTEWNDNLRRRTWDYVGRFIGNDLAGWGVWAVRTEDHTSIRIYCWGIVVVHVYLLLFIASECKVRKASACWIDGAGEVVVQMQP